MDDPENSDVYSQQTFKFELLDDAGGWFEVNGSKLLVITLHFILFKNNVVAITSTNKFE